MQLQQGQGSQQLRRKRSPGENYWAVTEPFALGPEGKYCEFEVLELDKRAPREGEVSDEEDSKDVTEGADKSKSAGASSHGLNDAQLQAGDERQQGERATGGGTAMQEEGRVGVAEAQQRGGSRE